MQNPRPCQTSLDGSAGKGLRNLSFKQRLLVILVDSKVQEPVASLQTLLTFQKGSGSLKYIQDFSLACGASAPEDTSRCEEFLAPDKITSLES